MFNSWLIWSLKTKKAIEGMIFCFLSSKSWLKKMEKLKLTTWTENSYVLTLLKVTDHFLNKNTKIPKKIVKYLFESSQKNCICNNNFILSGLLIHYLVNQMSTRLITIFDSCLVEIKSSNKSPRYEDFNENQLNLKKKKLKYWPISCMLYSFLVIISS